MGSCFSVRSRDNVIRMSGTGASVDSLRSSLLDQNMKSLQLQGQANDSAGDKEGNEALETYQSPMLNDVNAIAGNEGNGRALSGVGIDTRRKSTSRPIFNATNPLTNASSLIRCEYAAKPKADWFIKRGQFIKSWKRRYFVLDGWELRYFEDAQKAVEKGKISLRGATCRYVDDSNSSGGANIIISSISFVEGALNGVTGVGGRELVVECDSSYKAENWMDALMDVLLIENTRILRLIFPDAPQPIPEALLYPNPYINQPSSSTNHSISPSDLAELIKWCRECVYWYEDAIDVLETSFVGVMSGVNANGDPTSERCVLKVSTDRKNLLWRTLRPEEGDPPALDKRGRPRPSAKDTHADATYKSSLNAKSVLEYLNSPAADMVIESDPSDLKGQFCSIPFSSIRDICLGSLKSGDNAETNDAMKSTPAFSRTKSNNSTDSAGFGRDSLLESYYPSSELHLNNFDTVLSIVTPFHSLEVELDEEPISESSMWVAFLGSSDSIAPSAMRRSSLGRLTMGSDEKASVSTVFMNTGSAANKVTPQQLAMCPKIMRRHPFIRSLRTVLLLRPYIPMLEHIIRTTSINTAVMNKQSGKGAKSRSSDKSAPKKAQLRPVQRIWEKTGQLVQAN